MKDAARSRWICWAAFFVIAILGLALRLPQLGARPMHTDEAVNAYIVGQLQSGESFKYDSQDRHGPALAALALPLTRVQGAKTFANLTESNLRLTSVLAGTITILLFGFATEMFGVMPCILAALLFAIGSLPVYYDRYFIHESLFVAATFGLILSGWRACKTNSIGPAVLAGVCAALMLACKETAVLHFIALASAGLVFYFWNLRGRGLNASPQSRTIFSAVISFLFVCVLLYTWFGRNWNAVPGLFHAVPHLLARAGGEGHQKHFWYYGQLLTSSWSGRILVAFACIGFLQALRKRDSSAYSFLAFYAVFIAGIYSLIPYKTPWLALNFWLPLAFFAALAMQALWQAATRHFPSRLAITGFCLLGSVTVAFIAHDTRLRVFLRPSDETNPYAYAHTSDDILGLPAEIEEMAHRNGIANPRIAVIASDPWPLPWYLRRFSQVGFWRPGQQPGEADFYITSTDDAASYTDQLKNFRPEFFGVRPGVLILLWSSAPK